MGIGAIGGIGFSILYKVLFVLVILVIGVSLWFVSHRFFKWRKEMKNYKIVATIFNPDGSFYIRHIGKFKVNGIDKFCMIIKNKRLFGMGYIKDPETLPTFDPKYVKNGTIVLWRYGVGQFGVIDTNCIQKLDPKDPKINIDVINLQMKNFAFLEQRADIARWAAIKKLVGEYGKLITLIFMVIGAGVIVWLMLKTSLVLFDKVTAQRLIECSKIGISAMNPLT